MIQISWARNILILVEGNILLHSLVMLSHLPVALLTDATHNSLLLGPARCPGQGISSVDFSLVLHYSHLMDLKFCPKLSLSHYWAMSFRWQRCSLSLEISFFFFFQESAHFIFFHVILGVIFFGFLLQVLWRTLEFTLSARELLQGNSDCRTGWPASLPVASFPFALTGHQPCELDKSLGTPANFCSVPMGMSPGFLSPRACLMHIFTFSSLLSLLQFPHPVHHCVFSEWQF